MKPEYGFIYKIRPNACSQFKSLYKVARRLKFILRSSCYLFYPLTELWPDRFGTLWCTKQNSDWSGWIGGHWRNVFV